ncbi:HpcH/HpaI aldolase family protein [Trueperella pecoris]|uniref:HpcH/HpaI aldolase family protein n=1 Tax=Trueperella pecoris TaxID=2733571 RepID=UPI001ABECC28|nr:aldolase/citrate lyase family protein [Trueperella pecoris]QTG75607.1 2-dehydro-3-deoxyglucarate aldolase [Trueperella pecoris]
MSFRVELPPTFGQLLRGQTGAGDVQVEAGAGDVQAGSGGGRRRGLVGMWVTSGSTVNAEICAGAGLDWILIDGEHAPLGLSEIQSQLQVIAAYPTTPVVRVPVNDRVHIKQFLDLGAQNLLVPMVNTPEEAQEAVRALRYPPEGVRGVGSALARGGRWNRVPNYLTRANDELVSLIVQIETIEAVENAEAIAATGGVDAIFIGPSDLAASMGLIGQQGHPEVVAAVHRAIDAVRRAGKPVGINAFDPELAHGYLDAGIDFILVGADVALLARQSEKLAADFIDARAGAAGSGAGAEAGESRGATGYGAASAAGSNTAVGPLSVVHARADRDVPESY